MKNLLGVFGSFSSPTRELRPCGPVGSPVGHQVGNFEIVNLFVWGFRVLGFGFWPRFRISIHSACYTKSNKINLFRWLDDVGLPQYKDSFLEAR